MSLNVHRGSPVGLSPAAATAKTDEWFQRDRSYWLSMARNAVTTAACAEVFQRKVDEANILHPDHAPGYYADMLQLALDAVDWDQLAADWVNQARGTNEQH